MGCRGGYAGLQTQPALILAGPSSVLGTNKDQLRVAEVKSLLWVCALC